MKRSFLHTHLLWLVFLVLLGSCERKVDSPNEIATKNTTLISRYFEKFNNHQWNEMAAMYADSAEFKDPSFGFDVVWQSRRQIAAKYTELASVFPDLRDSVQSMYSTGNEVVVVEFVSTGTGPDSITFELPICTIFTIRDGLIIKDHTYYDNFEEPIRQ